ncbi:MAG TPA: Gfo/Idh/MocA family oxidoreductase [Candidatus Brocadiia bacterium]|nr:Gfo/Idh/MocA family oxidoreductase [Candidatus Brocadiia bacterium]
MKLKLKAAILGYGRSGSTMHAGAIQDNADSFEMAAACDVDPARRKEAAQRFNCAVYADYHEMLAKEKLDLVSVITRSDQHCEMTCECLKAGVNVLVTKPWAVNADEGRRMIRTAGETGRLLMPWLPSRWCCVLRRLKELIDAGTIGNVFFIRRSVCSFATRNDWQTENRFGGGYLLNWGPHIVDPPVVLLGSKVASVYGRMKQVINPGDVEDVFFAIMNLQNGAVVQAEFTLSVANLPDWFVQGDRGTIVAYGQDMKIYRKVPPKPDDPTKYSEMRSEEESVSEEKVKGCMYGDSAEIYREIAQALRGEKEYPVKPAHALELSETFDAIRRSDRENRVVVF